MFDKVIKGETNPGLAFYRGISKIFDMSLVEVMIIAGEITTADLDDENLNTQFARLPLWQQRIVLRFIESLTQGTDSEENTLPLIPAPKPK